MTNKSVLIIGQNGFLGQALANQFRNKGWKVYGTTSNRQKTSSECFYFDIRSPQSSMFSFDGTAAVYCGYVKDWIGNDPNPQAYRFLREKLSNVPHHMFISSFSVINGTSQYALSKKDSETVFAHDKIVRPGLIVGNGGVFLQLKNQLTTWPIFPLIEGGKQEVAWIAIEDVVSYIEETIAQESRSTVALVSKEALFFREFCVKICKATQKTSVFINVPVTPILGLLKLLRAIRILRSSTLIDRIQGLRSNANVQSLLKEQRSVIYGQTELETCLQNCERN